MMRYDHTSTAFWLWSSSPATINKWCRHGKSHRNLWNDSRRWELGGWAAKRWLAPPKLFWLVVWNMAFIFPNSWDDDPIWLIFFRGVETTNQYCVCVPKWKVNADMLQLLVSDRRRPCWGGGCCEKISSLWRGCVMRCNEYIRVCICRYIYNYIYIYIYNYIYIHAYTEHPPFWLGWTWALFACIWSQYISILETPGVIKCEIFLNECRSCEVLWGLCGQGNLNQAMFCVRACRGFNGLPCFETCDWQVFTILLQGEGHGESLAILGVALNYSIICI